LKKVLAVLSAAAVLLATLTACSVSGIKAGSVVNIGETSEFNSINADNRTSDAALAINREVAALVDASFFYTDASGKLVPNVEFGAVTVVGKNPLKVKYSLTGKAKWSDGVAISADDLLLSWLAARNPADAGFDSVRSGSGLKWTTSIPLVSADKKSLTVTYDRAVADWQSVMTLNAPAHIVAQKAFGLTDSSSALVRFEEAVSSSNLADQTLISRQYSNLFVVNSLVASSANSSTETPAPAGENEIDGIGDGIKINSGAYLVEEVSPGISITLKANPDFTWGPPVSIETVNIKFYQDSTAMLSAMQAGDVDICAPSESGIASNTDLINLAKAAGAKYEFAASHDIEAILLNFGVDSAFSTAKSDVVKAAALRDAFLKLIPRTKVLAALSKDNPVIEARSWIYSNGSNYYTPFVQSNGSSDFQFQNAEAAGELLKTANIRTPVDLRVLFDSNNPRAKMEFALLGQYAAAVGFNLIDVSTKDPRTVSATGMFDVLITTVPLAGEVGGDPYWFTGGSVGQFADPALDALLVTYSAKTDALDQISVLKQVDAELYLAKFGLPLYQVPALLVYGKRIKTIVDAPYGGSATYGYWNWTLNG